MFFRFSLFLALTQSCPFFLSILLQYVEGTRQWLYDRIDLWIQKATTLDCKDGSVAKTSRMFLLLAGPVRRENAKQPS